jgi:hypothetical protein
MTMATPNLVQLAPNLSAEERYKLISADLLARMDGEPPMLSESETKAMLWFASKATWREYALRVCMFRLAHSMWIKEIETEKLRTYVYYLHASHTLERIVTHAGYGISKKRLPKQFESLKKCVADVHRSAEGYLAYRDAIPKLEEVLCGVPFYGKTMKASIASQFALIGESLQNFNDGVRDFCACRDAKKFIKPIVDDMESYLIRDIVPSKDAVKELVDFIQERAESEMQSRD